MVILSSVSVQDALNGLSDTVANHRTGETCTLTFKPRGWRGNNAFEIKGNVVDSSGNTAWDIAGSELKPFVL